MVEQRPGQQPDDEPTPLGGQPPPGGAVKPAAPQLDPEQLRQFQQFQQFQDFLRYTEAQRQSNGELVPTQNAPVQSAPGYGPAQNAPAPGPPTQAGHGGPPVPPPPYGQLQPLPQPGPKIRAPKWAKRLAGKLLSALLFLIVLIVAGKLAYNHFFPSQDEDRPASETGGGQWRTNKIFSTSPYEAIRMVYAQIAQNRPDLACGSFDTPIQQKFAEDLGYPDCQQAVFALKAQVTNINSYAESIPSSVSEPPPGDTLVIDSCRFPIQGGPALGTFTVQRVEKGQWLITGHEAGRSTCPPPSTAGTPTSR
ncbi:hypothetical protein [Amycolatopsis methanolica]|uniref:Uncharacterized protein n=1 Tax=Amycolatopsis methanolica 239 TaxID=1068978 RepID=A0A076MIZ9_AMYME|nr:hypothetical protein [Amycolatopsis methanolica]AIJ20719.1 hypothetical protein AMETH_0627 [Amycolatopsis methanolica 239]